MLTLNLGEITSHALDPIYPHTDTCLCGHPFDLEHLAEVAADELGISLEPTSRSAAPAFIAAALELYNRGYTDAEISRELGVTRKRVFSLRRRRGLPANIPRSRREVAA